MRRQSRKEPASSAKLGAPSKSKQTANEFTRLGTSPGSTSLEAWIRRLGVEVEVSMKHGRRDRACSFMSAMYAAIRARSPAQQHRREMEIAAAIWGPQ